MILFYKSWTLFNNECLISYAYKKLGDTNYKLGETTDVEDYDTVLGKNNSLIFLNYILIMYAFNVMYLLFFSKSIQSLNIPITAAFLSFILYIISIRMNTHSDNNNLIRGINFISNFILLGFIVNMVYR